MRITKINTSLRYSAEAKSAWRSIEVGCEATLTASEATEWETAQAELHEKLKRQVNRFWSNGNGKAEPRDPSPEEPLPVKEHWCEEHQQEWTRQTKAGSVWYSHRTENGWCNAPKG